MNPTHYAIYHWSSAPSALFVPAILDFLLSWLLLSAVLLWARRPGRWRVAVWAGVLLMLPSIALKSWALYEGIVPSHVLSRSLFAGGLAIWLAAVWSWRPEFQRTFDRVVELTRLGLALAGLAGVLLLTQVVWFGWDARDLNQRAGVQPQPRPAHGAPGPRVIWLILDELSYRQVFEHRYPGLRLPAFDALASDANVFTNVVPVGNLTERVVPALISGKPDDLVRSSPDGALSLRNPKTDAWSQFDPYNSVFEDALKAGDTTAVVGWHNPYCRILAGVVDRCLWSNDLPNSNGMLSDGGILSNMLAPLDVLMGRGVPLRVLHSLVSLPPVNRRYADFHIEELEHLTGAADQVVRDPAQRFVLVHLPIPHPPGIYSRSRHQLTDYGADYIDNLALADKYLAHLRSILEQTGQWDGTVLVVIGDHGWRAPMWKVDFGWTPEEENASRDGRFDPRPAYIVKLAGERQGRTIDVPFDAIRTRPLLDALMTRQIQTSEDLEQFVRQTPGR